MGVLTAVESQSDHSSKHRRNLPSSLAKFYTAYAAARFVLTLMWLNIALAVTMTSPVFWFEARDDCDLIIFFFFVCVCVCVCISAWL